MQSEHKEVKSQYSGLNPFFTLPPQIQSAPKIQLDDVSRKLIQQGDSKALNLFDDAVKATLGQRYVMVAFIKDNIVHLRAIPGFEFVEDKAKQKALAEKAAKFFQCGTEYIAFPDHAIWTGVVHEQLIKLVHDKEPKLKDATIVAFSMIKKDGKYSWLNRSARNWGTFKPDPVASACFVFEEKRDYTDHKPPMFDLFYHLTRSIPMEFFEKLIESATETICVDDPIPLSKCQKDSCMNMTYETRWETIRKLFSENKAEACKQIQHMLMTNVYVYFLGFSSTSTDYRGRALTILKDGLRAARVKHGIIIDLDYIPTELLPFEEKIISARTQADMDSFLITYKYETIFHLFSASEINVEIFRKIFKTLSTEEKTQLISKLIDTAMEQVNSKIISILYDSYLDDAKDKELVCSMLADRVETYLLNNKYFTGAKKCLQLLPKEIILPFLENYKNTEFSKLLHPVAKIILGEILDFKEKNADGKNLLHLASEIRGTQHFIGALLEHGANPDTLDYAGTGCMAIAAARKDWDLVNLFLSYHANPNVKDQHGKSPLDYALIFNDEAMVRTLLLKGAKFSDAVLTEPEYESQVKRAFSAMLSKAHMLKGVEFVTKIILAHDNPNVQAKLVGWLFTYFENEVLELNGTTELQAYLLFKNLPVSHLPEFNRARWRVKFLELLDNYIAWPLYALELIENVTDPHGTIGQYLLEPNSTGMAAVEFRTQLNARIIQAEHLKNLLFFGREIREGRIDDAKSHICKVPVEKMQLIKKLEDITPDILLMAEILAEEKPDFNKKNADGKTALFLAVEIGDIYLITALLAKNADPNIPDNNNLTCIAIAAANGRKDIVELLLEKNANPNVKDQHGRSPLDYELSDENNRGVFLLIEYGAKFCPGWEEKHFFNYLPLLEIDTTDPKLLFAIEPLIKSYDEQEVQTLAAQFFWRIFQDNIVKPNAVNSIAIVKKILQLDVPIYISVTLREQVIKLIINFINKITDKDEALGIISALQNSQGAIGKCLLRSPTTDFYNMATNTLKEFLKVKKTQLGVVEESKEEEYEKFKSVVP